MGMAASRQGENMVLSNTPVARVLPCFQEPNTRVAVVIPCYRVARHIVTVIQNLPSWIWRIVVVDDASPDESALLVSALSDPRIVLVRHERNQGVGGAMITGYKTCLELGAELIVKMDGDDQMDPGYLPALLRPLLNDKADYAKGNRWSDSVSLRQMPALRRVGNLGLSFLTKFASGYWSIFDPCNGYTAITATALQRLDWDKIARTYFFEISMLVQLNVNSAVAKDVPMPARYGDEQSSLRVRRILLEFPLQLVRAARERIWSRHFIQDFSAASAMMVMGSGLTSFGFLFGSIEWVRTIITGMPTTAGTVMLATLPFLMGFQLLLQSLNLDIAAEPTEPLSRNAAEEPLPSAPEKVRKAA
jgi:dolichol-phosphate mannosyltransferase